MTLFNLLIKRKMELLIGLHVGAGKVPNRWSLDKYSVLMKQLKEKYNSVFYLTGSNADRDDINYLRKVNLSLMLDYLLIKKFRKLLL